MVIELTNSTFPTFEESIGVLKISPEQAPFATSSHDLLIEERYFWQNAVMSLMRPSTQSSLRKNSAIRKSNWWCTTEFRAKLTGPPVEGPVSTGSLAFQANAQVTNTTRTHLLYRVYCPLARKFVSETILLARYFAHTSWLKNSSSCSSCLTVRKVPRIAEP